MERKMKKNKFILFFFFLFTIKTVHIETRKVCNVLQFGTHAITSNKENRKYFNYEVVGIIDPFDKNRVLWTRKKRNKKFNLNIFKNIYDSFFCNINDYNTLKYMLKYKIISGKFNHNGDKNIMSLKENSKLFRFLNNINI
ncbi:hypothetical protein PFFVO_05711 [Plasmodium falciparum Vietnam Oak-Knoll (FVO)]|uniref:Uncharacterized protein n=1 Tax=Plasmodium falciparum Vietnam Oak-Knoll (FVO) TaxID=1036723 RepID=A0A024UYT1_PLAFA|nr:hypothetical protein PFFVO_05711 [Plasmodium falciparum Vietnam Oak-Knoll (FVO)]